MKQGPKIVSPVSMEMSQLHNQIKLDICTGKLKVAYICLKKLPKDLHNSGAYSV